MQILALHDPERSLNLRMGGPARPRSRTLSTYLNTSRTGSTVPVGLLKIKKSMGALYRADSAASFSSPAAACHRNCKDVAARRRLGRSPTPQHRLVGRCNHRALRIRVLPCGFSRHSATAWRLLRLAYSPLAGAVDDTLAERQQDALEDFAAHTGKPPVKLWLDTSTPDQPERRTHAVWLHPRYPRAENDPSKPNHKHHIRAAILVGGNCQTWADMTEEAKFLLDQGLTVLSLTLSGYPDPDESYGGLKGRLDWTPTEVSMLDDGVAALRWLTGTLISASTSKARDAPVNDRVYCDAPGKLHGSRYGIAHHEVLVEGHSLGSCLAHLVAAHEPSVAVTVMQPLASIAQVSVYASVNKVVDVAHLIAPIQKSRSLFVMLFGMPMLMLSFVYAQMAYNGAGLEKYDRLNRCWAFKGFLTKSSTVGCAKWSGFTRELRSASTKGTTASSKRHSTI